jgi:mannose-6-phosphate isomerase-like protein (cupin superfamily)
VKVIRGHGKEVVGEEHGTGVSLIFVNAEPGRGASLHKHEYDEIFIVLEGEASVLGGDEELDLHGGDIVIVPAGEAHGFVNSGGGPLRQIDVHVSPRFVTEWLG